MLILFHRESSYTNTPRLAQILGNTTMQLPYRTALLVAQHLDARKVCFLDLIHEGYTLKEDTSKAGAGHLLFASSCTPIALQQRQAHSSALGTATVSHRQVVVRDRAPIRHKAEASRYFQGCAGWALFLGRTVWIC